MGWYKLLDHSADVGFTGTESFLELPAWKLRKVENLVLTSCIVQISPRYTLRIRDLALMPKFEIATLYLHEVLQGNT